ncbi:MAG: DUF2284 domain-containing protein [Firmicutes bacterium]|nr:DUF2284 domain-containing protein [Bacillota bacterium]
MEKIRLEALFRKHGFNDFKWIKAGDIVVSQWVRFKCMFGCDSFGKQGACPPYVPSVAECREFISEYQHAALFHFSTSLEKPEDNRAWTRKVCTGLLKLERDVFLAGYYKAFLLFMGSCYICSECEGSRLSCKNLKLARPSPEALAIDVYATVRQYGYPIEVLQDYKQELNKYGILLIE